jgi:hypothetical protein
VSLQALTNLGLLQAQKAVSSGGICVGATNAMLFKCPYTGKHGSPESGDTVKPKRVSKNQSKIRRNKIFASEK